MARAPKTVADIDKEIEALKAKRAEMQSQREAHIGKIASKAGLTELNISDADLKSLLEDAVKRFQNKTPSPKAVTSAKPA